MKEEEKKVFIVNLTKEEFRKRVIDAKIKGFFR